MHATRAKTKRGTGTRRPATKQGEQVTTPYARLTLGWRNVADMDTETRETLARGLTATIARMDEADAQAHARREQDDHRGRPPR